MTFERKIAVRVKLAAGQGEKEEGEEDRTSTKRGPRAMQCGSKQNKGTPHGAKAAEVYGIVGYLLSLISFGPAPNQYSPAALARLPRSDAARVVHASASACACACAVLAHCFLCVCAVVWIVWAYTPDWVLESLGVTYYPDRYWAIALPMFGLSLVCYLIVVYNAWNLCNTHPFHSYYTIQDSADMATRVKDKDVHAFQATDSIPPAEDIPITKINRLLFCTPQSD